MSYNCYIFNVFQIFFSKAKFLKAWIIQKFNLNYKVSKLGTLLALKSYEIKILKRKLKCQNH
ncbi:hypothetical protein JJD26997_0054 [Campylobacter jejuni subsp. doylei 269.97]|uniref:Uncharacterized protein n=1 Tax=Campylobacter jejuni subsp. doylei (strain ATCC BAA-1458 / RM4099 / 269.97) TaxID=360109 RepID=A7H1D2_CAMJD|nr:hypothetical protein JJD26997_0054 [Campylobacter jejuni subsp. doylei 269.97]